MNPFTVLADSPTPCYEYNPVVSMKVVKTTTRLVTTPQFFMAIKSGDLALVKKALDQGISVDTIWKGNTLLNYAIFYDQPKVVEILLDHGADPTIKSPKYNMDAFEEAVDKQEILAVLHKTKIN